MEVRPFKPSDYINIKLASGHGFARDWVDSFDIESLRMYERVSVSETLLVDGNIVAIIGCVKKWGGVGEVLFIPAQDWENHKVAICRYTKKRLEQERVKYHRVQLVCRADNRLIRFGEFMGFKHEAILKQYDKKRRDFHMMSWVKEEADVS